ncbi:MAG: glycosyltransferase [Candidatus Dormibacteria bacterium]
MRGPVRLFVGYDKREALAYHVFCQSVLEKASVPVAFYPVHRGILSSDYQRDGTNAFTFSRYLVPLLCDLRGWALFADGDMVCQRDIAELWDLKDENIFNKAVSVVKHDYKTQHRRKYIGSLMESQNKDYPRKNWSSVMLWNCSHAANAVLTEEYVSTSEPRDLHRFSWLKDEQIGELPRWWNHLVGEDPPGEAALYHFTLGVPGIKHYADDYASWNWHSAYIRALACAGEYPLEMTARSANRVGEADILFKAAT